MNTNTEINVMFPPTPMIGAKGDGVADDTTAIQNVINAYKGNVYFPVGVYRTTAPILLPQNSLKAVNLRGAGRRWNGGLSSKIIADHSGDVISILNALHSGVIIESLQIGKSSAYNKQGNGIRIDASNGKVSSHVTLKDSCVYGHNNGIYLRGAIYTRFENLDILNNNFGLRFNGVGTTTPTINVHTSQDIRCASNSNAGIHIEGASKNLSFYNLSLEASGTGIYIAENAQALNLIFDGVWFELQTNYCCDFRSGANISFKNVFLADQKPLFRKDTFNTLNVTVDGLTGADLSANVGVANVNISNFRELYPTAEVSRDTYHVDTISPFTRSYSRGFSFTPIVSSGVISGESVITPILQLGKIKRNWIEKWDMTSSSWIKTNVTPIKDIDPFGLIEAFSFTTPGTIQGVLVGGFPTTIGIPIEMTVWVKGKGKIILRTQGDNASYRKSFEINTDEWVRLTARTKISLGISPPATMSLTFAPDDKITVWRPCVFDDYHCIDVRPKTATGTYEGGDADYLTYKVAKREYKNITVYGTNPPNAGNYCVSDKVINIAPSPGGFIGWVCIANGAPGIWKGYGSIET
ncbi:glycosyl hydrolase family 28-related protein [Peribacillus butanolivorans]|uniref:glycosyl hydrolase family 28-related protein n=1 Tax=Peribacillus butanolivorans TaxID=421767 RepID=UPI0035E19F07